MTSAEENQNYEWQPTEKSVEDPYQTTELATVQGATVGSAPVRYNSAEETEPMKTDSVDNSPTQSPSGSEPSTKSEELCRDFLNGRCGREGCKYKHDTTLRDSIRSKVCKDFQNSKCMRTKCKYLHLTEAEYEEFKKTGVMPVKPEAEKLITSTPDICRDFLKGLCGRGGKCKYSHMLKTDIGLGTINLGLGKRPYSALSGSLMPMPSAIVNPIELNEKLKHKLIDLRKQVLELTQLNDVLYNENMKLRKQTPGNSMSERTSLLQTPVLNNGTGF